MFLATSQLIEIKYIYQFMIDLVFFSLSWIINEKTNSLKSGGLK